MLLALIAFYAASLLAAALLLWRDRADGGRASAPRSPGRLLARRGDAVGWVSIHGPIYHSQSGRVWEQGVEQWSRRIQALAEKSEVKALVLDINSPGGSVGAVQELHSVVTRVRMEKKKPVVALIGDVGASGGYYVAVACDKVVAHPGSLLGSIGVIFNSMNVQGLFDKFGVRADPIKSGRLKDIGSPTRPMTKEERELLQGIIDDTYGQFLAAVAKGRGMPQERVRPVADGRIFNGRQAADLGLVDLLGDARDAVGLAGKLAGLTGAPRVVRDADSLQTVLSLLDSALGRLRPEAAVWRDLAAWASPALEYRWSGLP